MLRRPAFEPSYRRPSVGVSVWLRSTAWRAMPLTSRAWMVATAMAAVLLLGAAPTPASAAMRAPPNRPDGCTAEACDACTPYSVTQAELVNPLDQAFPCGSDSAYFPGGLKPHGPIRIQPPPALQPHLGHHPCQPCSRCCAGHFGHPRPPFAPPLPSPRPPRSAHKV